MKVGKVPTLFSSDGGPYGRTGQGAIILMFSILPGRPGHAVVADLMQLMDAGDKAMTTMVTCRLSMAQNDAHDDMIADDAVMYPSD